MAISTISNIISPEVMNKVMSDLYRDVLQWEHMRLNKGESKAMSSNIDGTHNVSPKFFAQIKSYLAYHRAFEITNGYVYGSRFGRKQSNVIAREWEQIEQALDVVRAMYLVDGEEPTVRVKSCPATHNYLTREV